MSQVWQGKLNLTYDYQQNKTQLVSQLMQAPLKIQRSFYPEGAETCHTTILHTAGGIVGGDQLLQTIHLKPYSQVVITTPSASKIYRSNGLQSQQNINIYLDAHSCLEYIPQESIIFNQANYQQTLNIYLTENSHYFGWEWVRFGRTARGETFIEGNWRSNTHLYYENKPLWVDRQWFPASEILWNSPHGLFNQPLVGTIVYSGKPLNKAQITAFRQLGETFIKNGEYGVTRTQNHGLLCRYRGSSLSELKQWSLAVWSLLREEIWSRSSIKPRVWSL